MVFQSSTQGVDVKEGQRQVNAQAKDQLAGLWLGYVEDTHDPLGMGRMRVRVMEVHKMPGDNKTKVFDWAKRIEAYGGAYGMGSFMPLEAGTSVWVMFPGGDAASMVVVGVAHKMPIQPQMFGHADAELLPVEEKDSSASIWKGASAETTIDGRKVIRGQSEVPAEAQDAFAHEPTVAVPFKTKKGASIVIEERDELESMEFLDRSGQGLRMSSPIAKHMNRYNGLARGTRSVFKGNQPSYQEDTANREAEVALRDLAQQGLTMEARANEERVTLLSRSLLGADKSFEYHEAAGNAQVIDLSAGANRTLVLGTAGGEVKFMLSLDANRGVITIESDLSIELKTRKASIRADRIILQGDVAVDGHLTVSEDLLIGGSIVDSASERAIAG